MTSEMKKQILNEYFDYNGKRYYWGTRFTMNYENKEVTAQFSGRSEFNKVSVIIDKQTELDFAIGALESMKSILLTNLYSQVKNTSKMFWHTKFCTLAFFAKRMIIHGIIMQKL